MCELWPASRAHKAAPVVFPAQSHVLEFTLPRPVQVTLRVCIRTYSGKQDTVTEPFQLEETLAATAAS